MREIGSEFWEASPVTGRKKYLLSGRTALEYIIRDILNNHSIESVLLPSYCCHTMIEPFIRHGISARFYDVYYDKCRGLCADIPERQVQEIFYYMTYFGFSKIAGIDVIKIRKEYDVIIEDKTHSWLDDVQEKFADYSYVSFRKWTGFYGIAEARKYSGYFASEVGAIGKTYSWMRNEAMLLKKNYIENTANSKDMFLSKFSDAEEYLEMDYIGYTPTEECLLQLVNADFDYIKEQRKENTDILLRGLSGVCGCIPIYKRRKNTDTPLFVPILVDGDRDGLRKYLIEHQVYCPVHWPLSDYHKGLTERGKEIYQKELSLVCDQRYGKEDMERTVSLIWDYFNERISTT